MMNELQNGKIASDLLDRAEYEIRTNIERDPFRIFNVFEVLSVQYKEVIMCRMLKELLDPNGKHGKGNKFLKLFFKVTNESSGEIVSDEDLDKSYKSNEIVVDCEHEIDDNRRIDILIRVGARYIPIEVKIYAGEQQNQVQDYLNYCNKMQKQDGSNDKSVLLYLTLDGHNPSAYSVGCKISNESAGPCSEYIEQDCSNEDSIQHEELKDKTKSKDSTKFREQDKTIIPISFKDEICRFLEQCIKEADNESLFSNLKQYLYAIETISGKASTPVIETLSKKLKNKADFKAVDALNDALAVSKTNFLQKLFELIEKKLKAKFFSNLSKVGQNDQKPKSLPYKLLTPYNDYDSVLGCRTLVNDYYSQAKVYPSIIILFGKKVNSKGTEYYFGITFEIEWKSYVGIIAITKQSDGKFYYCDTSKNDTNLTNLLEELISKLEATNKFTSHHREDTRYGYIDWEYVSANNLFSDKTCTPDFKALNDEYYDLLDHEEKRQKFADKVVERFEKYFDALNIVLHNC